MALRPVFLSLLALAAAAPADGLTAIGVFRKAVQVQGGLKRDQVRDVYLRVKGATVDKDGEHGFVREYWYRKDGSLRIRTRAKASARVKTQRGVLGKSDYWEMTSRGKIISLSKTNRDDKEVIRTIIRNRREFERIFRMVMLTRLDDGKTTFVFATKDPVTLDNDLPYSANSILGRDRSAHRYHVIDVKRENEDPLRLFIHTRKSHVVKAIQYSSEQPGKIDFVYYFGPFKWNDRLGLNVPLFFSAHEDVEPTDEATRKSSGRVRGEILVELNEGLTNEDLKPASE